MADAEVAKAYEVTDSRTVHSGRVITLRLDTIRMSDATLAQREVVIHPGAVGVVALDEDGDQVRVVTVSQYRHPVGERLVELPAGLLDVEGESALAAAKRELVEEAQLTADEWYVLVDLYTSPGMSSEAIRIYLARGLHSVARADDFELEHEELELEVERIELDELVRQALAGELTNSPAVAGILAAAQVVAAGLDGAGRVMLRAANAPWRARPGC